MSIGYAGAALDGTDRLVHPPDTRRSSILPALLALAAMIGAAAAHLRRNVTGYRWPVFDDLVWAGLATAGSASVWGHGVALLVAAGCWVVISRFGWSRDPGAQ